MFAVLDLIKVRSWSWFTALLEGDGCLFSDWCSNPIACLRLDRKNPLKTYSFWFCWSILLLYLLSALRVFGEFASN